MYGLVSSARSDGAGLLAAAFVAMVPSYISRSVAGSYDNEAVAIFALVNVFHLFIRTINTGSLRWGVLLMISYLYMVMSWGGYSFVINMLPIFVLAALLRGTADGKVYLAFAPLVAVGTLMAVSIPVVGFNAVLMSEHFAAFLVCGVLHIALLWRYLQGLLPPKVFASFKYLALLGGASVMGVGILGVVTGEQCRAP